MGNSYELNSISYPYSPVTRTHVALWGGRPPRKEGISGTFLPSLFDHPWPAPKGQDPSHRVRLFFLCRMRRFSAPEAHVSAELGQLSGFVIGAITKIYGNLRKSPEISGKSRLHVFSRGLPCLRKSPEIYGRFSEIFVGAPEISGRSP